MTTLALVCALFLFVSFADRVRQICWQTEHSRFVCLYLANMLWSLALIYDAITGAFCLVQFVGVGAMLALLHATRLNWAGGMPESFRRAERVPAPPNL